MTIYASSGEEKFCNNFVSDADGSHEEFCIYKSQGHCKNDERSNPHNQVGGECHKKGKEPIFLLIQEPSTSCGSYLLLSCGIPLP